MTGSREVLVRLRCGGTELVPVLRAARLLKADQAQPVLDHWSAADCEAVLEAMAQREARAIETLRRDGLLAPDIETQPRPSLPWREEL